jgi:hypothetical protein
MWNHKVFHVSQLDHYTPPVGREPCSEPHPVIVNDSEQWEVEQIPDSKQCYQKLHYIVHLAGYNQMRTSREPFEILVNSCKLLDEFHQDEPNNPQR